MTLILFLALSAQKSPASRLFKGSRDAENPPFAGFIRAHKEKGSAQTVLPLYSLFCLVRASGGLICPGGVFISQFHRQTRIRPAMFHPKPGRSVPFPLLLGYSDGFSD